MVERVEALMGHREWRLASGEWQRRRSERATREIEAIAVERVRSKWHQLRGDARLADLAAAVVAGSTDPYTAADKLLES